MTIGAWVIVGLIAFTGLCITASFLWYAIEICRSGERAGSFICAVVTIIVTVAICAGVIWYQVNSASGQRALKNQESNLNGGINRTVSVYDVNGNLIQQYTGKFDIDTDKNSYILFDDENGNRHIIYYTTGTIIIDEN